jgi:hypothetical protein
VIAVGTVADEVREHARHHLPALQSLHIEIVPASERKSPEQRPQTKHEHHH